MSLCIQSSQRLHCLHTQYTEPEEASDNRQRVTDLALLRGCLVEGGGVVGAGRVCIYAA